MVLPQPLITFSSRHLPRQSNPFKYICIYVNIYIYIYIFTYIHIYIHIYIYDPAVAHCLLEAPATPELRVSSTRYK